MKDERLGLPSASGAHRFVACAISHRLQAQAQPDEESEDPLATEGSIIHQAFEMEDGSELTLTQSEILTNLQEIDRTLYEQWRIDFPVMDKGWEVKEERLFVFGPDMQPTGSAKPDHLWIIGNCALLVDAKTGFLQVEDASTNMQGRLQALAVVANNPEVEHVRVAFAQFRFKKHYTFCDYSVEDLKYALFEWNAAVWRSKQPDATANPGPWCKLCRARSFCKAAGAIALLPSAEVKNGQVFTQKQDPVAVRESVYAMTIPDLVAIFERRTIIENVLDAVKRRLKGLPEETLKELGYEKREGARYITKVEVNPLFQALWDDGFWNHIPSETRQDEAVKEFSTFTTALTGKLEDVALPRLISSGRFKLTKEAKSHLRELIEKCSAMDTKEPTIRKLKSE